MDKDRVFDITKLAFDFFNGYFDEYLDYLSDWIILKTLKDSVDYSKGKIKTYLPQDVSVDELKDFEEGYISKLTDNNDHWMIEQMQLFLDSHKNPTVIIIDPVLGEFVLNHKYVKYYKEFPLKEIMETKRMFHFKKEVYYYLTKEDKNKVDLIDWILGVNYVNTMLIIFLKT